MTDDHDHKNCLKIFEKLSEFIDQELDDLSCQDIQRHLENCPCCNVCAETLKRTIDLCKEVGDEPVPKGLSDRLRELVHQMN